MIDQNIIPSKSIILYDIKWPMSMILRKSSNHPNNSVTRYVVKSFMKMNINIDEVKDLIYTDLIKLLNLPIFYKGSDSQKDSKFYVIIQLKLCEK